MKEVLKQIKNLQLGDLIRVDWYDASIGKSIGGGSIDVPVKSWGIYLGVLGEKNKHIVLAQNGFKYSNGIWDVDFTSIPLSWAVTISVLAKNEVKSEEAQSLLQSFLLGRARTLKRRTKNHERHD